MADSKTLVYFLQDLNAYKVGATTNLPKRLKALETGNPYIRLITHSEWMSREDALWLESSLHVKYAHRRIRGEWFDLNPREVQEIIALMGGRKMKHMPVWGALAALIFISFLGLAIISLLP